MMRFILRMIDLSFQAIATALIAVFFLATIVVINFAVLVVQVLSFFIYGLSFMARYAYKFLVHVASL